MKYFAHFRGKKGFPAPAPEMHTLYIEVYETVINAFARRAGSLYKVIRVGIPGSEKLKAQANGKDSPFDTYDLDLAKEQFDEPFRRAVHQAEDFNPDGYIELNRKINRHDLFETLFVQTDSQAALDYLFPPLFDDESNRRVINEAMRDLPRNTPALQNIWHLGSGNFTHFARWNQFDDRIPDDRGFYVMECNEEAHLLLGGALISPHYGNSLALYDYHWADLPTLPDDEKLRELTDSEFPLALWHLAFDRFISDLLLPF